MAKLEILKKMNNSKFLKIPNRSNEKGNSKRNNSTSKDYDYYNLDDSEHE